MTSPAPRLADDPGITVLRFDGIPADGLVVMRVRSYPNDDQNNLVSAVAADNRLTALDRVEPTVGGEPATRLVGTPVPGTTASEWFCPDSDNPCSNLDPIGHTTRYLFDHQGSRHQLSGGGISDSSAQELAAHHRPLGRDLALVSRPPVAERDHALVGSCSTGTATGPGAGWFQDPRSCMIDGDFGGP